MAADGVVGHDIDSGFLATGLRSGWLTGKCHIRALYVAMDSVQNTVNKPLSNGGGVNNESPNHSVATNIFKIKLDVYKVCSDQRIVPRILR